MTNTTTILPKVWRATGCPDNMPGCLVAHSELVVDTTAKTRTIITECVEQKHIFVAGQLLVQTNQLLWRKTEKQTLQIKEEWVPDLPRTEASNHVSVINHYEGPTNTTYAISYNTQRTPVGTFPGWTVVLKTNQITK